MLVLMLCIRPIIGVDETRYYGARHFVTFDENVHVGIEKSTTVVYQGRQRQIASRYHCLNLAVSYHHVPCVK